MKFVRVTFNTVYFFIFIVLCSIGATSIDKGHGGYKISMVSSDENPGKPALFTHAESPVWDPAQQSLFFVDVLEQNVHRLDYVTGKIYTKHIGYGQVNIVSLIAGSRRLLVTVRSAFYLLDWDVAGDAALRLLASVDDGLPDNVLNDGKPDAEGRFWAGTKGPQSGDDVQPGKATLYSIDQATFINPRVQLRPVTISNGLVWSLNNSVLYYIDSPTQKIEAFDFDLEKGDISGRRTILDITNYEYEDAIPDGMTIDSQGHLWVALMFGGKVIQVDPERRQVLRSFPVPAARTTALCWGGPALDELFVTSGRERAEPREPSEPTEPREPLAGALFSIRGTGSRGVPPNKFRFDNADSY